VTSGLFSGRLVSLREVLQGSHLVVRKKKIEDDRGHEKSCVFLNEIFLSEAFFVNMMCYNFPPFLTGLRGGSYNARSLDEVINYNEFNLL
jgi:hypothetical protein